MRRVPAVTRVSARAAIDAASNQTGLVSTDDALAAAAGAVAVAESTFYFAEQVERIADMIADGFYVERGEFGHTVYPKDRR